MSKKGTEAQLARERAEENRVLKIAATRDQMVSIYVHQFKRRCFILLMRAFVRWVKVFPITMKCNEIAKQLSERNFALESIRTSYLRDVVLVKHHLEQLASVKLDDERGEGNRSALEKVL